MTGRTAWAGWYGETGRRGAAKRARKEGHKFKMRSKSLYATPGFAARVMKAVFWLGLLAPVTFRAAILKLYDVTRLSLVTSNARSAPT